jgi:hypothetical protein
MGPTELCGLCKNEAEGYAWIDDVRYCHGNNDFVTCYMRVNLQNWDVLEDWFEPE